MRINTATPFGTSVLLLPRSSVNARTSPTVGATPKCRDLRTITFDSNVEVFTHEVEVMIPQDYDPSELRRPQIEPTEWLWGNLVAGFYDPVVDLAVARFKAASLANGTGPISSSDEYVEPSPHPEDVGPFFVDWVHEREDRRLPGWRNFLPENQTHI